MKKLIIAHLILLFSTTVFAKNDCRSIEAFIGNYEVIAGNCAKKLGPNFKVEKGALATGHLIYRISNSAMGMMVLADQPTPGICKITNHGLILVDREKFRIEMAKNNLLVNYRECSALYRKISN